MSIKWSQFADYDPTLGEPGDMEGVGLQGGQNVRWPAWFFQSVEAITTSHSTPKTINPNVYATVITSDGSGLSQDIKLPVVSSVGPLNSVAGIPGRPHLIIFDTRTVAGDFINVTTDATLYYSPFGPGATPWNDQKWKVAGSSGIAVHLTFAGAGLVCFHDGTSWWITGQTDAADGATFVPPLTAGRYDWGDPDSSCPAVLYQEGDGSYNAAMDPTNPQFQLTVTASANISTPTVVPGGVRCVRVDSAGNGGNSYIKLEGPAVNPPWICATGIEHVVYLNNKVNPADHVFIAPSWLNSSIRNADGSFFTSFELDGMICAHWDNVWIVDRPTNCTTVPPVMEAILGQRKSYALARFNSTYTLSQSQNYASFTNAGAANNDPQQQVYNLPAANQTGNIYTFSQCGGGLSATPTTISVVAPASTTVMVSGRTYTSPTFSSSQAGATISFRDYASPGYVVETITGAWSIT